MIDDTKPAASLAAIHVKRTVAPDAPVATGAAPAPAPIAAREASAAPDAPAATAAAPVAAPGASAAPPAIPDPPPLALGAAPRRIERRPVAQAAIVADEAEGFLTWRRAGWFGLLYMGALLIFAVAFDLWPAVPR